MIYTVREEVQFIFELVPCKDHARGQKIIRYMNRLITPNISHYSMFYVLIPYNYLGSLTRTAHLTYKQHLSHLGNGSFTSSYMF